MAYAQEAQGSAIKQESLTEDAGRLLVRLRDLHERLATHGDHLLGSVPRPAENAGKAPEQQPNLKRSIALAHDAINDLFQEMDRITARM